ncbi:membrane protein [Erysipelotrichaceae bacterium]|nr:membrane protein [Erysipelotrichaceae bacterium]
MLEILLKSILIGAMGGFAIGAGAARMFHAPDTIGMGAFRTLGYINTSKGDGVSHATVGSGFALSSAATSLGTGALTQDVFHRVIPNLAVSLLALFYRRNVEDLLGNPAKMGIASACVGMIFLSIVNTVSALIPTELALVAAGILAPASALMISYVMPLLFIWAACDAGDTVGFTAILLAGIMQLITGNALPGAVLGILLGYTIQENGFKNNTSRILITIVVTIILLISYFRGYFESILSILGLG